MKAAPLVVRRRLSLRLRQLRDSRGLTIDEVARLTSIAKSSISRYENVGGAPSVPVLRTLLDLYEVPPEDRGELIELVRAIVAGRGWWTEYGGASVPDWMVTLIGLETEATALHIYHHLIPGLLQIPEYARAVIAVGTDDPSEIDRYVDLRAKRQEKVLGAEKPPRLHAVVDQGALLRHVSSDPDVMRRQGEHLLAVSREPNVTLQILPFSRGAFAAAVGSGFVILEYATYPDSVYLEHYSVGHHLEGEEQVSRFRLQFEGLAAAALSPDESRRMLANVGLAY